MKRRDFLKSSLAITAVGAHIPNMLFGIPKRRSFRWSSIDSDRIVVLVKLNGGNDGLNTIVPFQETQYYQQRPTLALTADETPQLTDTAAMHPAMTPLLPFYEEQKMSIIQGVGYPNGNLSHFRSSDVWDTGSNEDEYLSTGWLGRLLELEYPGFPDNSPEYPLSIQYNSANLLEFKTSESNTVLYLYDPDTMYAVITGNYVADQDNETPDTYGGDELEFLREMDFMSFGYSEVINQTVQNAPNTVLQYPETNIGQQFALTARLIAGGLATPFYRLYQHGYDTHIEQQSRHTQLLDELSSSLAVFLSEMEALGLLDRILVVTTSEFGRRVNENGANGTDHGTSAPTLIFGSQVNAGIFGNDPDFDQLDGNGNLQMQFDYRQIYSTLITHCFGLAESTAQNVFGDYFAPIPFIDQALSTGSQISPDGFALHPAYPNPFNPTTTLSYTLPIKEYVIIRLLDPRGRTLKTHRLGRQNPGRNTFRIDGRNLASGAYFAQVESGGTALSQKITLLK